jgi:hypothetical protein
VHRQPLRLWPRSGRPAIAGAAAVLACAALLPALGASASAQVATSSSVSTTSAVPAGPAAAPASVLLIDGDLLSVRPAAGGSVSTVVAAPGRVPLVALHLGAASFEFPVDALPYLGHGLDPSLFDVPLLQRLESHGRLAVRLTFAGATPRVPGITITSSADGSATGYLTASSAKAFGAALDRQYRAEHATGNYSGAGLFAGVSIALAGVTVPQPVHPDYPMHTLTVTGTNAFGKADTGDEVLIINADNPALFGDPNEVFNAFHHGVAKYSVPAGHYWAIADFAVFGKRTVSQRMVVLPQFDVAGSTAIKLAARSATSKLTISTPRPASNDLDVWSVVRYGLHHNLASFSALTFDSPLYVSPTTEKPADGSIQSTLTAQLASPPHAKGVPYGYNLDFIGPMGVIPAQHWTASPASLATVADNFYLNTRSHAFWAAAGGTLSQLENGLIFGSTSEFRVPGPFTQYLTGSRSIVWQTQFFSNTGAGQTDDWHTVLAGQHLTENWNQYPLHPQPEVQVLSGKLATELPAIPSSFVADHFLWLINAPFSDNDTQFGHAGGGVFSGKYTLSAAGHRLAGGRYFGFVRVKLTKLPPVLTLNEQFRQPQPLSVLSPVTDTTWTMHTNSNQSASIPRSWECATASYLPTQHCAIQPMLTVNYQVAGLGLNGVTSAGQQTINVHVGHIAPGPQSAINSAAALVSWDNGLFWQPASITSTGAGNYRVRFNAPAGVNVSLKFTAADPAANSIAETITDAYSVGS